jgi:thioredoxin 1
MKIINSDELTEIIKEKNKTLVLFSADWCGPCKILSPNLEKIEEEIGKKLIIVKADISEIGDYTQKYGIRNIPTCVLIEGENEISRFSGVKKPEEIKTFLMNHLDLN